MFASLMSSVICLADMPPVGSSRSGLLMITSVARSFLPYRMQAELTDCALIKKQYAVFAVFAVPFVVVIC